MSNGQSFAEGVVLSMGILSKLAKLSDPVVGFIAGLSQLSGSMMYAFAYSGLMVYLGEAVWDNWLIRDFDLFPPKASTVDMMNGTMTVIARSMMSKVVDPAETGQLFSLLGVFDALTPLAMNPFYNLLYNRTVETFSGTYHLFSGGLTILPLIVYLWDKDKNKRMKGIWSLLTDSWHFPFSERWRSTGNINELLDSQNV